MTNLFIKSSKKCLLVRLKLLTNKIKNKFENISPLNLDFSSCETNYIYNVEKG